MIVDPTTGQPIQANTMTGQVGIDALAGADIDVPIAYDLLASMPTLSTTSMWNMNRVANTMTRGGRRNPKAQRIVVGRDGLPKVYGLRGARGVRQTVSPLSFRRFATVENIDSPNQKTYSPFNVLARTGNRLAVAGSSRMAAGRAGALTTNMMNRIGVFGAAGPGEEYFSRGTMGRLATMGRIFGASDARLARMQPNIINAFQTLNPTGFDTPLSKAGAARFTEIANGAAATRGELSQMAGMSMRGRFSQGVAGYTHMAKETRLGVTAAEALNLTPEGTGFRRGAETFTRHLSGEAGRAAQYSAKAARFALPLARAAGPIGSILLARDLAVMGGRVVSELGRTAIEGAQSVKGSIDKPIMGMGYRDNMVAATSRQRGVQAIANSRLNMRSVLGSEASAIHAVWG